MATFTAAEKKQMWKLFKLRPMQLSDANSVYNRLITCFEELDTSSGDLFIPDIQAELVSITADQATLATLRANGPVQEMTATGEGTVEFVDGATSFSSLKADIAGRIKCIRDQIDPQGFLNQWEMVSKAIPTT